MGKLPCQLFQQTHCNPIGACGFMWFHRLGDVEILYWWMRRRAFVGYRRLVFVGVVRIWRAIYRAYYQEAPIDFRIWMNTASMMSSHFMVSCCMNDLVAINTPRKSRLCLFGWWWNLTVRFLNWKCSDSSMFHFLELLQILRFQLGVQIEGINFWHFGYWWPNSECLLKSYAFCETEAVGLSV